MLQVFDVPLNGTTFKLRELSFKEARAHSTEGQEMIKRQATVDEWYDRTLEILHAHIAEGDYSRERLAEEFSKTSIETLYAKLMEVSGLRIPAAGEAKAA